MYILFQRHLWHRDRNKNISWKEILSFETAEDGKGITAFF